MVKPIHIFLTLVILYLTFSISIYTKPNRIKKDTENILAKEGRLVWQKYNCQGCHQLYGLGGYLGPDLTNLLAEPSKDKIYINAILHSGVKQMPKFNLTDEELSLLVQFLKSTNQSGISNPKSFIQVWNGTIKKK